MAKPKIFVSHGTEDNAFASKLVEDLNDAGAQAWMDVNDLGAGNFQQGIDEALANCEWFLLVLTHSALSSEWVRLEVYAAIRLKNQQKIKGLIFVKAADFDQTQLPATWGVFNIFDAISDYEAVLEKALKAVGLSSATTDLQHTFANSNTPAVREWLPPQPTNTWSPSAFQHMILQQLQEASSLITSQRYYDACEIYDTVIRNIGSARKRIEDANLRSIFEPCYKQAWAGKSRGLAGLGQLHEANLAKIIAEKGWPS